MQRCNTAEPYNYKIKRLKHANMQKLKNYKMLKFKKAVQIEKTNITKQFFINPFYCRKKGTDVKQLNKVWERTF